METNLQTTYRFILKLAIIASFTLICVNMTKCSQQVRVEDSRSKAASSMMYAAINKK